MKSYHQNQNSDVTLSKALSRILRHTATKKGLTISSDGYIPWDELATLPEFKKYTFDDVQRVVKTNDKQRFSLKEENGKWYIRANQGHSHKVAANIKQEDLLTKLTTPLDLIVHGTTYSAYESIKKTGLKKMGRSHIHFAITDDIKTGNQQQSGIRGNCQVLVYLDMAKAMNDGIEFFISDNKVVLSSGVGDDGTIDAKYFSKIIDRATGKLLQ